VPHRRRGPAAGGADRPVAGGEHDAAPLSQRRGVAAGLGARALLDGEELPSDVVDAGLVQPDHHLQREHQIAVEVAVQRVPVTGDVAQQDRCRLALPGRGAHGQPLLEGVRPGCGAAQPRRPVPRDRQQVRVEGGAQVRDDVGQRVREIAVLTAAEPEPGHVHRGAEPAGVVVERSDVAALGRG
jgi:hypothetical protein